VNLTFEFAVLMLFLDFFISNLIVSFLKKDWNFTGTNGTVTKDFVNSVRWEIILCACAPGRRRFWKVDVFLFYSVNNINWFVKHEIFISLCWCLWSSSSSKETVPRYQDYLCINCVLHIQRFIKYLVHKSELHTVCPNRKLSLRTF